MRDAGEAGTSAGKDGRRDERAGPGPGRAEGPLVPKA